MSERHVFACLVHERPEVVADLVANLQAFEPGATILLYDGSPAGSVLNGSRWGDNVRIHPSPRPMRWGRLHDFAIDSMRFAVEALDADAITVVDSDQMLLRAGYVDRIEAFLAEHPTVGMLGNEPGVQPRTSMVDPVRIAWREPALWKEFLDRLPGGSGTFPHWTFWPSTVFSREAAADLVHLFDDLELTAILRRTRMFATEEIVLPTLVAALGYDIAPNPARYDYVRYRVDYGTADLERALAIRDAFWMHPVPRRLEDPVRARIRALAIRAPRRPGPTGRTPGRGPARIGAVRGGLDTPSLLLLADVLRNAVATAKPDAVCVEASRVDASVSLAAADLLSALGDSATVATSRGSGAPGAVDVAVLDDERGFIEVVSAVEEAGSRLRAGAWLYVFVPSIPMPKVEAALRALAGEAWEVRRAGRAFAVHLTAQGPVAPPAVALADLRGSIERMVGLDGWFQPDEAVLLAAAAAASLRAARGGSIVELGSFCGRATTVLGGVARRVSGATVAAVDRFDGIVGEAGRTHACGPTLGRFRAAMAGAGLGTTVREIVGAPSEVAWSGQIDLLLVDGLHDYGSVAADFRNYERWIEPGGVVAFHDYGTYPDVTRFVDELVRGARWKTIARLDSLILLVRSAPDQVRADVRGARPAGHGGSPSRIAVPAAAAPASPIPQGRPAAPQRSPMPLVSCLMPTFDRRDCVPAALERFLAQDYPERELIVVDDGTDPVGDLMPDDPRIRYVRLPSRMTIGAKRNLGAEIAAGEILANWDDDDWVASWRLSYEVDALVRSQADVVGLCTLLYYEPSSGQAWRYAYPHGETPWVHDPTLCLRRAAWERDRFPDSNFSLDTTFLSRGSQKRVVPLENHRFYVGMIHAGNTSRKDTRGSRWRPTQAAEIVAMMARDAADPAASAGDA